MTVPRRGNRIPTAWLRCRAWETSRGPAARRSRRVQGSGRRGCRARKSRTATTRAVGGETRFGSLTGIAELYPHVPYLESMRVDSNLERSRFGVDRHWASPNAELRHTMFAQPPGLQGHSSTRSPGGTAGARSAAHRIRADLLEGLQYPAGCIAGLHIWRSTTSVTTRCCNPVPALRQNGSRQSGHAVLRHQGAGGRTMW